MKKQLYFSHSFTGKGSWTVTCEVETNGTTKTFTHRTTDAEIINEIRDAKCCSSWEYAQRLYKSRFYWAIEDEVNEWLAEEKQTNMNNEIRKEFGLAIGLAAAAFLLLLVIPQIIFNFV